MIEFLIDIDKKTLKLKGKEIKFDFPIYQIAFCENVFFILFHPGSDNRSWGKFQNLYGVDMDGKILWKAELPDNFSGCFDRINLINGQLHTYVSTYDCTVDPTTGRIISTEFYK